MSDKKRFGLTEEEMERIEKGVDDFLSKKYSFPLMCVCIFIVAGLFGAAITYF